MSEELQAIERKRAERKAKLAQQREAQRVIDMTAVDQLEEQHGDHMIRVLDVDCGPGLPTLVVAKAATPTYLKRYRDRLRPKKRNGEDAPDFAGAGEELGAVSRLYPDQETFDRMLAVRPGVLLQIGTAALELAVAEENEAGKA